MIDTEILVIISIVILILCYNIYKIFKLYNLSQADFPQSPAEKFKEWKKLELQSSYIIVIAILTFFILRIIQNATENQSFLLININIFVLFGGIIFSLLRLMKAEKIKKRFRFNWRRPVELKRRL